MPRLLTLAACLLLLTLLAWPLWPARSQDAPLGTAFEPLTLQETSIGELVEGNADIALLAPFERPPAPVALAQEDIPAPEGLAIDFSTYSTPEQIETFLRQLEAEYPDLIELYTIGTTWQGRDILAARVANESVPGSPVGARPAMYTDAQHHARELISKETSLYTLWWLVSRHGSDELATHLVDTRASYFVPSVNVDGNHIAIHDNQDWRKTANPACCDDDQDGAIDEDPPVGYGFGAFQLSRYTFTQEWVDEHPDNPFAQGWWRNLQGQPENLGRFRGDPQGDMEEILLEDADGDGRAWEDPVGGVDSNRNYDWFWEQGDTELRSETYHGPEVFSEPQTRAVRDFVTSLPHLATGLSYHSGVDVILFPWGYSREAELPDAELFERLGRKGSQLTEVFDVTGSPHVWTARGLYGASGSTMDWLYGSRGIYAFSPEVYGGNGTLGLQRTGTLTYTVASSTGADFNPPPADILTWTERWRRYATFLLAATPNVELTAASIEAGEFVLGAGNDGFLPVDLELALFDGEGALQASTAFTGVQHAERIWRAPLAATEPAGPTAYTVLMTATLTTGTVPHVVETATWQLVAESDGSVTLADGDVTPLRDLGAEFGGWYAGPEWGVPKYTCFQGCSGIVLPEDLTYTPEPPTPTPMVEPTATPVPEAEGIYLPRLERRVDGG